MVKLLSLLATVVSFYLLKCDRNPFNLFLEDDSASCSASFLSLLILGKSGDFPWVYKMVANLTR